MSPENDPPHKRFKVTTEEDRYRYEILDALIDYANDNFETYILEKEVKSSILLENPVPNNIDPVKKLDDVLKSILRDKNQSNDINFDNILEKIQGKVRDVMGPLSKLWLTIEGDNEWDQVVSRRIF